MDTRTSEEQKQKDSLSTREKSLVSKGRSESFRGSQDSHAGGGENSSDPPDLTTVQAKVDPSPKRSCKSAPLENGNWRTLGNSWDIYTSALHMVKIGEG